MTDKTKKPALRRRFGGTLPYESIDELLSQLKGKDAESVLDEWGPIAQLLLRVKDMLLAVHAKPLGHGDGVLPKLMKVSVGSTVLMIGNAEAGGQGYARAHTPRQSSYRDCRFASHATKHE